MVMGSLNINNILRLLETFSRGRVVVSVSVSTSRSVPTSRLGLFSRKIVNASVSSRSRPFTSRAQDQFSAKLYRHHLLTLSNNLHCTCLMRRFLGVA